MAKEKMGKDEIPEISPLARQQPPKGGSPKESAMNSGVVSAERFRDKMTNSLCK